MFTIHLRNLLLCAALLLAGACDRPEPSELPQATPDGRDTVLAAAASWLWQQQAEDGGWHSDTYRLLESGQALTPFVLHSLMQVDESVHPRPAGAVDSALQFIRKQVGPDGSVGLADPAVPEYPNYATAYALMCLNESQDPRDRKLVNRMTRYLMEQQYRDANGFGPETVVHGGWGFGGSLPTGGSPGHMDIHHTRCILEALQCAGVEDPALRTRAQHFLRLVQRHPQLLQFRPQERATAGFDVWNGPYDGGFYFSPIVLAANKAGMADSEGATYFRSYASATCDGILGLLAAGVEPTDERIQAAREWLARHPQLDWPGGVPEESSENWGESIRFTHFANRALVMAALDSGSIIELQRLLAEYQRADGSFKNEHGFLMKEDDPLLCTALAILALQVDPH